MFTVWRDVGRLDEELVPALGPGRRLLFHRLQEDCVGTSISSTIDNEALRDRLRLTLHLDALSRLDPAAVWANTVWIRGRGRAHHQHRSNARQMAGIYIHCFGAVVLTLKATGCAFWLLMLSVLLTSCVNGPAESYALS